MFDTRSGRIDPGRFWEEVPRQPPTRITIALPLVLKKGQEFLGVGAQSMLFSHVNLQISQYPASKTKINSIPYTKQ